ncbi:MAG: type II toxin-antitoxin system VapC family toxin [Acidobacteria bacterium]|nr:type II toxin-antitoxin system VapC family toxin [Acidobacteriota bacterium]
MKTVFADTLYWVSGLNQRDQWYDSVIRAEALLDDFQIVTTESVLIEVLNYHAEFKSYWRQAAVNLVRDILANPDIEVVLHSHDIFLNGLKLYESRPDKGYSVTDCISMNVMRERGISEVLTHDHHFAQEGFVVLI